MRIPHFVKQAARHGSILAAVLVVTLVHADPGLEPIDTRNHRSVSMAFLRIPFLTTLPQGKEFSLRYSNANEFRQISSLEEDAETSRLAFRYRAGRWFFESSLVFRGGGFMDGIIDGWHKNVLHWSDPLRKAQRFGRVVIRNGSRYSFASGSGLGDTSIGFSHPLSPRVLLTTVAKLPTGDAHQLLGSGGFDLGAAATWRIALARKFELATQAGLVVQGRGSALPGSRGLVDQESLALIYARNSRDTWIAQWNSERAPITTGVRRADSTHRMLSFAFRRKLGATTWLEAFFSEDQDVLNGRIPEIVDIAPDFTFGLRLIWHLR